jgi:hypothetical protein
MMVDIFPASLKSRGRRGNAPVQTLQRYTVKKCAAQDCTRRVCTWDDMERTRSRHKEGEGKNQRVSERDGNSGIER